MKILVAFLLLCGVTLTLFACIDPQTPLTLTGSTFEKEELSFNSRGIHLGEFTIYFDEEKKQWCYWHPQVNDTERKKTCGGDEKLLKFTSSGKVVGAIHLDSKAKKVTLYQVKRATLGTGVDLDKFAAHIVFEEKSSGDMERIEAYATGPDGMLGSVVAERNTSAKTLESTQTRNKIDLSQAEARIAGCSEAVPRTQARNRFIYGDEIHK